MARITDNYASHLKDDLQAEADARGLKVEGTGANDTVTKDDLVDALEDNDTSPSQPPSPLPPLVASKIPQVPNELPANIPKAPGEAPDDSEYDGLYTKDDGEQYALAITEDAPNGRTHHAKNSRHYWNGTKEEFKAQFTKK